jgi:RNA polymerase primary sigma factor
MRANRGISDRLREALRDRGWTQADLAGTVGASQPAVSQWLSGRKTPAPDTLAAIADRLGVRLEWLERGTGEKAAVLSVERPYVPESNITWAFRQAPGDGGRDYGNPNVWSFTPDITNLVRETLQNSIDAALGPAVEVVYRIIRVKGSDRHSFLSALRWSELERHIRASQTDQHNLGKLLAFGLRQLESRPELLLLVIEDRGAVGLIGDEAGTDSNFAALCRNNLDSQKQTATAGGAYGLGKAVLTRTSVFSTVIFNSNLSQPMAGGQSEGRLIGRSDLAWHEIDGEYSAGPGWFGAFDDSRTRTVSAWGNAALAEALYISRPRGIPGTSILIVGFYDPSSDESKEPRQLADELEEAVAEYFWPALVSGSLTVRVQVEEGRSVERTSIVSADGLQPELADAVRRHRADEIVDVLANEGDVVRKRIPLKIPERRAERNPHGAKVHEAILLIRRAPDDAKERHVNEVALFRGQGMIIEYLPLPHLQVGAIPFHAAVLCGTAAGNSEIERTAELFLRTAEPPAHNRWTSTPELKTDYAPGGKKGIDAFIDSVREQIRSLVRPVLSDLSDGPQAVRELFRLTGPPTEVPERPRVAAASGAVDTEGRWVVEAALRVKPDKGPWRLAPVLVFSAETGPGRTVKWQRLEALSGCRLEDDDRLLIPQGTREARFRGVSDPNSHPVPAVESSVLIDVRKVEIGTGGGE